MPEYYKGKPSRIPRRFLEPWKILVAIVVMLLLFFFRFDEASSPVALSSSPAAAHPLAPVGFRPLNQSKIAIVTFTTDQKSYTHLSLKNKYHYTKLHGYDLIIDLEANNDRGLMWHKFDMIQRVIDAGQHDWIWWIDFDTLVMNHKKKVEDVITDALAGVPNPDKIDYLFTPDCFELNAGSFITRGIPRSKRLFSRSIEYHEANATYEHQMSEQDCMRDILFQSAYLEDQFIMLPQTAINSFPEEIKCFDRRFKRPFESGDLLIHFAGAWAHVKEEDPTGFLMQIYQHRIVYED